MVRKPFCQKSADRTLIYVLLSALTRTRAYTAICVKLLSAVSRGRLGAANLERQLVVGKRATREARALIIMMIGATSPSAVATTPKVVATPPTPVKTRVRLIFTRVRLIRNEPYASDGVMLARRARPLADNKLSL